MKYCKGLIEKKDDKLVFVLSDETKDRHGDILDVDNWDLSAFKKAPRMLVDHDHRVEKIVGKWTDIKTEKATKRRLIASPYFHEITELSRETKRMVEEGFLDTVSVGFIPHYEEIKGTDGKTDYKVTYELIEVSLVTVPANPSARILKQLLEKDTHEQEDAVMKSLVQKDEDLPEPVPSEEYETEEVPEETGETAKEVIDLINKKVQEKQKTLPKKGRRLNRKMYARKMRQALMKETVKALSITLYQINKAK